MKPISASVVEKTWQRVAGLTPREGKSLAERFVAAQPVLAAYLMAVDHDLLNDEER